MTDKDALGALEPCGFCEKSNLYFEAVPVHYRTARRVGIHSIVRVACTCGAHGKCRPDKESAAASWNEPWQALPGRTPAQPFDAAGVREAAQAVIDGMERPGSRAEYAISEDGRETWHDYHEVRDALLNDLQDAIRALPMHEAPASGEPVEAQVLAWRADLREAREVIAYSIIEGSAGIRAAEHAKDFQTSNWSDALRSADAVIAALAALPPVKQSVAQIHADDCEAMIRPRADCTCAHPLSHDQRGGAGE